MIPNQIQEKGILAKLLEKAIKILLKKECKKIGKLEINIFASSVQIIRGIIQNIHIIAKEINYKELLFDEVELEANNIKSIFKISNKELNLKNNFIIKFKLSLSENSLKTILFSKKWNWIGDMISKEILNENKFKDIKIKNGQLLIKTLNDSEDINEYEKINIKTEDGKIYLENTAWNKLMMIPIEDKV